MEAGQREQLASIAALKEKGKQAFKAKDWAGAFDEYTAALLQALKTGPEVVEDIHELFSNRVAAMLKMHSEVGDPERSQELLLDALHTALECCRAAPNWAKSHYRLGQVLEARQQLIAAGGETSDVATEEGLDTSFQEAYTEAARRSIIPDKAIAATLVRCGLDADKIKTELGAEESMMDEIIDVDDTRLRNLGVNKGLPQLPGVKGPDGSELMSGRQEQKQFLTMLIGESMEAGDAGDYRKMIECAVTAVKLATVLGDSPSTCFLFVQLATAYLSLRELPKAEAYARTAIEIAGPSIRIAKLMTVENPLAASKANADSDGTAPGLSHPRSSYSVKTQVYMMSTAYLALGNVFSARLKHTSAVQAYKMAQNALSRLNAPTGSTARHSIADALSTLHCNIGNQYAKEHMTRQAMHEYERSSELAKETANEGQQLRMRTNMARLRIESGDGSEADVAQEQTGLLAQWDAPGQEFGVRNRLAHMAIAAAADGRDPLVQRQWLERVMSIHESRGTPIDPVCSVCLDDVREGTANLIYTTCSHVFHTACLDQAKSAAGGLQCPNCRSPVTAPTSPMGMLQEVLSGQAM